MPWRKHGPTVEENLVTLCGTCHDGFAADQDEDHKPLLRELGVLPGPIYDVETLAMPCQIALNLVDGLVVPATLPSKPRAA